MSGEERREPSLAGQALSPVPPGRLGKGRAWLNLLGPASRLTGSPLCLLLQTRTQQLNLRRSKSACVLVVGT